MTKEEILENTDLFNEDTRLKSIVLDAMELYAKQEAINFKNFVNTNYRNIHPLNRTLSDERLFLLYRQSKRNIKNEEI